MFSIYNIKRLKVDKIPFCSGRFFPGFFRQFFPPWKKPDNPDLEQIIIIIIIFTKEILWIADSAWWCVFFAFERYCYCTKEPPCKQLCGFFFHRQVWVVLSTDISVFEIEQLECNMFHFLETQRCLNWRLPVGDLYLW